MGTVAAQPTRLGAYGSASVRGHDHTLGRIAAHAPHGSIGHVSHFPAPLFPTLVHISTAHTRQQPHAAEHHDHGHGVQYTQRPDAGRMDILRKPRRTLPRLVADELAVHRRHSHIHSRHGHKPPLRPHHTPPAQTRRHSPLPAARRNVPLRHLGQLLRRTHRMDRIRHTHMVMGRCRVRPVDIRQPRAARPEDTPALHRRIRPA